MVVELTFKMDLSGSSSTKKNSVCHLKHFFCNPAFSNSGKISKTEVSLFPSAIPATLNILIQLKIRYVLKKSIAEKTNYGKIKKSCLVRDGETVH